MKLIIKKILFVFICALLYSCSSFIAPPEKSLKSLIGKKKLKKEEKLALKLYRLSLEKKPRCSDLGELSSDGSNPLKHWVTTQYFKHCNTSQDFLAEEYRNKDEYPEWARQDLYEAIFENSISFSDQISAGKELIKYQKTQQQKLDIINTLLKLCEKKSFPKDEIEKIREEVAPRFIKSINPQNIMLVANDFQKNRQFSKSRDLYKLVIRGEIFTLEQKIEAWEKTRMSYKLVRDKKNYLKKTAALVKFLSKKISTEEGKDNYAKYSIILSRILWTKGMYTRAKKVLRNLLAFKNLDPKYKVDIYYHLGGIYNDQRKKKTSINFYIKAFNSLTEKHELKEKVLWNISWFYFKNKDYQATRKWLIKYEPEDDESENYRFKFWLAKTYEKLGERKLADKTYDYLIKYDQYGYYGQISHMDKKELTPIKANIPKFKLRKDAFSWAVYTRNFKLAQKIVDSSNRSDFTDYYHSQYFDKLIFKYFALDNDDKESMIKKFPNYPYPLAYSGEFVTNNLSNKVSAPLLMAIARQESAFNPFARSPADAFGLLQLIPSQAKKLSKRYKIKYGDYNDLYEPATNISLSSKLLEELMRRQRGNFIHFVAGYNAGETAVRRWKKRYKKLDDFVFIETIPYEETRKYVKLVARNYLVYKRLLASKNFTINGDFFNRGSY